MVALKHTRFAAKILLIAAVIGQNVCTAKKKLNRVPTEKVNILKIIISSGCNLHKQVLQNINILASSTPDFLISPVIYQNMCSC